jgi:hypothetical protein
MHSDSHVKIASIVGATGCIESWPVLKNSSKISKDPHLMFSYYLREITPLECKPQVALLMWYQVPVRHTKSAHEICLRATTATTSTSSSSNKKI